MGRKKTERFPERGKRLQTLLTESGMTQKELSQKIHFSKEHISYVVSGERNMSYEMARSIVSIFPSVRYEWLMGYDDFKTTDDYVQHEIEISATNWAQSWSKILNVQSKREDTADRAFDLFLCMYGKRGTELTWEGNFFGTEEYYKWHSNISLLYDEFKEIFSKWDEDTPIFYPILDINNGGNEIPCLAEDYIAAVNKVSDYARLVINDLINTSKEKAKEREKLEWEEEDDQEELEEDEEGSDG
jgi:transcriptional regulator with XRE-family HTH domain